MAVSGCSARPLSSFNFEIREKNLAGGIDDTDGGVTEVSSLPYPLVGVLVKTLQPLLPRSRVVAIIPGLTELFENSKVLTSWEQFAEGKLSTSALMESSDHLQLSRLHFLSDIDPAAVARLTSRTLVELMHDDASLELSRL